MVKIIFVKNIYEFWGDGEDIHGPPYIFYLLLKKKEKVQEHDLYLNQILYHFDFQKKIQG